MEANLPPPLPQREQPSAPALQAANIASYQSAAPVHKPLRRKPVPVRRDLEKRSYLDRPRSFWRRLSLRARIFLIVGLVALLALIIGLAAGLSSRSKTADLPLPNNNGGPYTGDLTYYAPGLGACGVTSSNGDSIVAVSHIIFDAVQQGSDPNTNPLCGKKLRAKRDDNGQEKSVDLTVVDRCVGCLATDLDVTEDTFAELAEVALGRVQVQWSWLESVPAGAGG